MKRKLLWGLAGVSWFALVFFVTLNLTFPSTAAAKRLQWEMQQASEGDYALELDAVWPSGVGLAARNISVVRVAEDAEDAGETVFSAASAWARVGVLSILGKPRVSGAIGYGAGNLDFSAVLQRLDSGGWNLAVLDLEADDFPLSSLPPIGGVTLSGQGALDLVVDLAAPEGMRKANGKATLYGQNLVIDAISGTGNPMIDGFDLKPTVQELDLALDITEGRAKITRGRLLSDLIEADLSGEVVLMEDLTRCRLRLKAVLKLGPSLKMFSSFLKDAEQKDGSFQYRITGTVANPSFRPEREEGARPTSSRPVRSLPDEDEGGQGSQIEQKAAQDRLDERRRRREESRVQRGTDRVRSPQALDRMPVMPGGPMVGGMHPPGVPDVRTQPETDDEAEDDEEPIYEDEGPFDELEP